MDAISTGSIGSILKRDGFAVLTAVLCENEVCAFVDAVAKSSPSGDGVMRSTDRYAIRRVMQEIPALQRLVWTHA